MEKKLTKKETYLEKKESILITINNSMIESESKKILEEYLEMIYLYKTNAYGKDFQIFQMANIMINCLEEEKEIYKDLIKLILVEFKIIDDKEITLKVKKHILPRFYMKEIDQNQLILIDGTNNEDVYERLDYFDLKKIIILFGNIEKNEEMLKSYKNLKITFKYKIKGKGLDANLFYQKLDAKLKKQNLKLNKEIALKQIKKIDEELTIKKVNQLYSELIYQAIKTNKKTITIDMFPDHKQSDYIKQLKHMPGLSSIKEKIDELSALLEYKKKFNQEGGFPLNMIFAGNPGTGKTMIARMCAEIFHDLGYIRKNKVIEITPNDLLGKYVGWTSEKTKEILESAKDGVLFIDEAYLLYEDNERKNSFTEQALIELMKYMETNRNVVIFAGYKEGMEKVLKANAGLRSRILYQIDFNDYSLEELVDIFKYHAKKENIKIRKKIENNLKEIIKEKMQESNFGNGRFIEKLLNELTVIHAKHCKKNNYENNMLEFDLETVLEYKKKYLKKPEAKVSFGFIGGCNEKTN